MSSLDYIIDFERVNQLTSSIYNPNDKSNPFTEGKFAFSVSRKLIKEYLDRFSSMNERNTPDDKMQHIINTLEYNKIIVHKSTIRDQKIDEILK